MTSDAPPPASSDLLARAHAGERRAYDDLIERYRARLLERIRMMLGPAARRRAESGDFLNDVIVRALERADPRQFPDEKSFLRWLTVVARNRIADELRDQGKAPEGALASDAELAAVVDAGATQPAEHAEDDERLHLLLECLEELTPEQVAVLELREVLDLPFPTVAVRLGCTVSRARLAHVRALARLGQVARARRLG